MQLNRMAKIIRAGLPPMGWNKAVGSVPLNNTENFHENPVAPMTRLFCNTETAIYGA